MLIKISQVVWLAPRANVAVLRDLGRLVSQN